MSITALSYQDLKKMAKKNDNTTLAMCVESVEGYSIGTAKTILGGIKEMQKLNNETVKEIMNIVIVCTEKDVIEENKRLNDELS